MSGPLLDKPAKPLVLLVEDDPNDVFFFERALRACACPVVLRHVADGLQATHYLEGHGRFADRAAHPAPQLVILDLNLPCRSGLEVLQWMRERHAWRECPVVILTSSLSAEDADAAKALGALSYHVKPTEPKRLPELVRDIFARALPAASASDADAAGRR